MVADVIQFLDDFVKRGMSGGEEAGQALIRAVHNELKYDTNFKLDQKIIIKVYANVRGLSKIYTDKRIVTAPATFADFVVGFNKAHPLCDFVDAGNHKEAADTKLKGNASIRWCL